MMIVKPIAYSWRDSVLRDSLLIAAGALIALVAGAGAGSAAQNAPRMQPASRGPTGLSAPFAQALADVGQGGVVLSSQGIGSVTSPAAGIYCLELSPTVHPKTLPTVTIDWGNSLGVVLFAEVDPQLVGCPAATTRTIEVRTYKGDTGGVGSSYQVPVLSPNVAFIVLVP
jgi:hypothetical protein